MIRVLHVVQSLDPSWGGIARVVPELARRLADGGIRSTIATLAGGRYGAPPRESPPPQPSPSEGDRVNALTFPASDGRLGRSTAFNRAIPDLVARADIVHLHGLWTGQNWAAGRAARRAGKPYVMTPHSMMMPWAWQRSWWKKRPMGWLFEHGNLRRAALIHALSEGEATAIRALRFNDRVCVIPNGIDCRQEEPGQGVSQLEAKHPELRGRRWIAFMSRIHPQKGIVPLMQGCFDAAALAGDWQLVIAGPDEIGLRSVLEAAILRKGFQGRVTFTDMLNRRQVAAVLSRAELLVQPSLSEGLSVSILEALAAGVPVLISPACNLPEVAAANAGFVVEPNRRAIAGALKKFLAMSEPDRRAMGARGRQLAQDRFSWEVVLPRYREMYESVGAQNA